MKDIAASISMDVFDGSIYKSNAKDSYKMQLLLRALGHSIEFARKAGVADGFCYSLISLQHCNDIITAIWYDSESAFIYNRYLYDALKCWNIDKVRHITQNGKVIKDEK